MPLSSTFALQWYGPGMASVVGASSPSADIQVSGIGQMAVTDTSTSAAQLALVAARTMSVVGTSSASANLSMNGVGKMALVGKVNELSQDDVTGAVLGATIENGLTLKDSIRLLLAVAAGKTNIVDLGGGAATVVFRDTADTVNRLTASMAGAERTAVTINPV